MKKNSLNGEAKPRQNLAKAKTEGKSSFVLSALLAALAGIAAAIITMLFASFVLSKNADPDCYVSLCALLSAAVAGFTAGKFAAVKMPQCSRILRAAGVWAIMAFVLLLASFAFPSQIADGVAGAQQGGNTYYSLGIFAAILIGAFLGAAKKNKRISKNPRLKRKASY